MPTETPPSCSKEPAADSQTDHLSTYNVNMGVNVTTREAGTGATPTPGQTVTIEYTGYLKDTSQPENKGAKYVL